LVEGVLEPDVTPLDLLDRGPTAARQWLMDLAG
jgi:hypothetical protein